MPKSMSNTGSQKGHRRQGVKEQDKVQQASQKKDENRRQGGKEESKVHQASPKKDENPPAGAPVQEHDYRQQDTFRSTPTPVHHLASESVTASVVNDERKDTVPQLAVQTALRPLGHLPLVNAVPSITSAMDPGRSLVARSGTGTHGTYLQVPLPAHEKVVPLQEIYTGMQVLPVIQNGTWQEMNCLPGNQHQQVAPLILPPLPPPIESHRYTAARFPPPGPSAQLPSSFGMQPSHHPVHILSRSNNVNQPRNRHPSLKKGEHSHNRTVSLQELSLSPLMDGDETIEIMLPLQQSSATVSHGGQPDSRFVVHTKLFCFFSPVFKAHLASLNQDTSSAKFTPPHLRVPVIKKVVKIKTEKYVNELDFPPRVEAGPMDLEAYRASNDRSNFSTTVDEADSRNTNDWVTTAVVVKLPNLQAQEPEGVPLPPVVGTVKPAAVMALINWLYLGSEPSSLPAIFPGSWPSFTYPITAQPLADIRLTANMSDNHFRGDENTKCWWRKCNISACTLIELWVLAGRLGMRTCQNDVIIAIESERKRRGVVETGVMDWVWANTCEYATRDGCPLRNLLIDQCAWCLDENWLDGVGATGLKNEKILSQEVLVDLVARLKVLHRFGGVNAAGLDELLRIEDRSGNRYWVSDEVNEDHNRKVQVG